MIIQKFGAANLMNTAWESQNMDVIQNDLKTGTKRILKSHEKEIL